MLSKYFYFKCYSHYTVYIDLLLYFTFSDPISAKLERIIVSMKARNPRKRQYKKIGPMSNETIEVLDDFYRPYNVQLAQLLRDDSFRREYWFIKSTPLPISSDFSCRGVLFVSIYSFFPESCIRQSMSSWSFTQT